jgi:MFS transporter, FSR family, fosmidomycin resistance protein
VNPSTPFRLPHALWRLTLAHALVDAYAAMIQPLWPDLQRGLALDDATMQWAFVLWSIATSLSQLVFGYYGDRGRGHGQRRFWLAVAVGVGGLCLVGLAPDFLALATLIVGAGLGISFFHPEAATRAGACSPADRSRALSIFAVGGSLGQAVGPIIAGAFTARYGLASLACFAPPGLALTALLYFASRHDDVAPSRLDSAAPGETSLRDLLRGQGRSVAVMLAIGMLRVLPALGVPLSLAYLLKLRGESNGTIGVVQSVFLGAIGVGSLVCAVAVRRARERSLLWILPALAAPPLWLCSRLGYAGMLTCVAAVGALLGAVMPILIGYGQRLLHQGPRMASSLTMGVTWGLGGIAVAALVTTLNHAGRPDLAFPIFAVAVLVSSALCALLPESAVTYSASAGNASFR